MTGAELIKLLGRNAAEAKRLREADELWSVDWLQKAIASPDQETPPWILDDDGVAHRICGYDSMWAMPVRQCDEEHLDPVAVIGWADPDPEFICEICGEIDDPDELRFQTFMRGRQGA